MLKGSLLFIRRCLENPCVSHSGRDAAADVGYMGKRDQFPIREFLKSSCQNYRSFLRLTPGGHIFKEHVGRCSVKSIIRTAKERRPGVLGYAEAMLIAYNNKNKYRLPIKKLYGSQRDEEIDGNRSITHACQQASSCEILCQNRLEKSREVSRRRRDTEWQQEYRS